MEETDSPETTIRRRTVLFGGAASAAAAQRNALEAQLNALLSS